MLFRSPGSWLQVGKLRLFVLASLRTGKTEGIALFHASHKTHSGRRTHFKWPGRRGEVVERTVCMCCPILYSCWIARTACENSVPRQAMKGQAILRSPINSALLLAISECQRTGFHGILYQYIYPWYVVPEYSNCMWKSGRIYPAAW